ncbi:hypothetical protein IE077_003335, partial [Cardiosporidium cionae]
VTAASLISLFLIVALEYIFFPDFGGSNLSEVTAVVYLHLTIRVNAAEEHAFLVNPDTLFRLAIKLRTLS